MKKRQEQSARNKMKKLDIALSKAMCKLDEVISDRRELYDELSDLNLPKKLENEVFGFDSRTDEVSDAIDGL
jgi:hypothetical protein